MKKKRRRLFVMVMSFLILLGIVMIYNTHRKKEAIKQTIRTIQKFSLKQTTGDLFTQDSFTGANWKVFIFFHSECGFCQEDAQQLSAIKDSIKNTLFLWISSESFTQIKTFAEQYQLTEDHTVLFFQDQQGRLSDSWGIRSTPQFLVYNPQGELVKNHQGAWRMNHLMEQINHEFQVH
ncbi:MAG: TlpA disulfide reductase family protein [Flavobacteriaceae bacterium]|nr:TlpA disulfide reductase family protein [Flavobacteriaceae bacterium]